MVRRFQESKVSKAVRKFLSLMFEATAREWMSLPKYLSLPYEHKPLRLAGQNGSPGVQSPQGLMTGPL